MTERVDPPSLDALRVAQQRRPNPWLGRTLAFITAVLIVDAVIGEQGLAETLRARRSMRAAVAAVGLLRKENAGLREQIRRLRADPASIEAVARQDLGLVRPGEILFVVKDRR